MIWQADRTRMTEKFHGLKEIEMRNSGARICRLIL